MSSINDGRENEFAYDESNIVGISENSRRKGQKILKSIKKDGSQKKKLRKNNVLHFSHLAKLRL